MEKTAPFGERMARNDKKQIRQPIDTDLEIEPNVTYEEIGRVHRYFLNWRNALFAGHITVIYAHVIGYSWLIDHENTWMYELLLLLSGLFMTLIFWGLELRTRELYRACLEAGKSWEKKYQVTGVYEKLISVRSRFTHSWILDWYFRLVSLAILCLLIFVYVSEP